MRDVIISFASRGREDYNQKMMGLIRSLKEKKWHGDTMLYSLDGYAPEYLGYPIALLNLQYPQPKAFIGHAHSEIPYFFKYALIQIAREAGYERIFWLDSSMRIEKNISKLLDESEKGIVAFDNLGHPTYRYISDKAVNNLGISEDELLKIPQTWGGATGWDFTKPEVEKIFDEIISQATDYGSFAEAGSDREGFVGHRHDQSCTSVIFYKHGVELLPYGKIVLAAHAREPYEYGKDYYIICGD